MATNIPKTACEASQKLCIIAPSAHCLVDVSFDSALFVSTSYNTHYIDLLLHAIVSTDLASGLLLHLRRIWSENCSLLARSLANTGSWPPRKMIIGA